jgi:predicted nucleic acid-binding protein
LLDTSVLVDVLRRDPTALEWLRLQSTDWRGFVSVISVFEILAGCRTLSEQRAAERRLAEFAVLGLSEPASELALRWYKFLRLPHGVGFLDCLIGATAKHHDLEVLTLNVKHFRPMRGLKVTVPY